MTYKMIETKDTNLSGNYQILDMFGRTCGVYFNKRDAMKDLKKLNKVEQ